MQSAVSHTSGLKRIPSFTCSFTDRAQWSRFSDRLGQARADESRATVTAAGEGAKGTAEEGSRGEKVQEAR